ncbi:branched-chain amino acid transport system II carrier protein [Tyzzerella sp. An114]|uniref:branched-chain amino acid transport system II carrier protein n=1 Tax=Tyzzerella sp. An114 TaxID=1965545 RepID=UPI000B440F35|nr:branched-chain amino acid transport system II carrier protein [Tyzzerella sp. An114]OUQ57166.1 branched-chain amino acid transport system II carrier protein [Tyzzerella sp. An114]
MRKEIKDILIIGFALFSMYFGAGNVIFPPFLGLQAGAEWISAFISYYIADIGLALLAIFAMLRCKSDIEGVIGRIGKLPSTILSSAIVLCIGPLLAIPRTAATVHEMTIMPIFGNVNVVITSVLFFLLILILCINESSVIDIVGKFLTPALIAGLIILIVKGIIDPIGNISPEPKITYIISEGISSGYQTMDVLASLIFGVIVLKSVKERGYTTEKKQFLVTGASGIVAGIGLFVIYGGLTYLGATSSELFTGRISRSELVINIVKMLFGNFGTIIFAIVVALACITTAAALVSSTGAFFNDITKGKLPYKGIVIFVCIFSAVTANLGLDYIIAVASPILSIIYPSAITLIVLTIFGERIKNDNVFKFAALGALISSIMEILMVNNIACHFMMKMPFASIGFSWVIPTIIFGIIGHFVKFGNNK